MGWNTIIALDLGKFKSVACLIDTATRRHRLDTLETTPQRLNGVFALHAHAHATGEPSRTLVVVQACAAAAARAEEREIAFEKVKDKSSAMADDDLRARSHRA